MDIGEFNFLCDPKTHKPLRQEGLFLKSEDCLIYPIKNKIPVLLTDKEVSGLNRKYQHLYDMIAPGYDFAFWFTSLFNHKLITMRKNLLKDLTIQPDMNVLETSIGTGANIPLFTKSAHYYGVDISMGMLNVCKHNNKKWRYNLQLAQANAEELPYQNNIFDVVFHVGGINFFNNIPKAIHEMIRVAKPGAQLLICDETQEHVDKGYKRIPFVRRFFKNTQPIIIPLDHIPKNMLNIKLSYSDDKRMYVITFNKP